MPGNLAYRIVIVLEKVTHLGPLVKQAAYPGPGNQPNSGLDTACPVHSRQKWVGSPPGTQLFRGRIRVMLLLRQPPCARQNGQVMVPGHLPDLLNVAGLRLVAMMDAEGEPVVRRTTPSHRIVEPVRIRAIGPLASQHSPGSVEDRVGSPDQGRRSIRIHSGASRRW